MTRTSAATAAALAGAISGFAAGWWSRGAPPAADARPTSQPAAPASTERPEPRALQLAAPPPEPVTPLATEAPASTRTAVATNDAASDTVTITLPSELWQSVVDASEDPTGEGARLEGVPHGPWKIPSTTLPGHYWQGEFRLGVRDGLWRLMDPTGHERSRGQYSMGHPVPDTWWLVTSPPGNPNLTFAPASPPDAPPTRGRAREH